MKTFQQIYDFCRLDATYNAYFNIPGQFECTVRKIYKYYHGNLGRGHSRSGTYIYSQSQRQLERFLKGQRRDFHIHIDPETYESIDYQKFKGQTIYIVAHIRRNGVLVGFNHPFESRHRTDSIYFTARSHRNYNAPGLIEEVKRYVEKNLLFPPGRYRDLQLEYKVPKERFAEWYKAYKRDLQIRHNTGYWEMYEKYNPKLSFEDSYSLLQASGAFYDFNCDEFERDEMALEFMDLCNR